MKQEAKIHIWQKKINQALPPSVRKWNDCNRCPKRSLGSFLERKSDQEGKSERPLLQKGGEDITLYGKQTIFSVG